MKIPRGSIVVCVFTIPILASVLLGQFRSQEPAPIVRSPGNYLWRMEQYRINAEIDARESAESVRKTQALIDESKRQNEEHERWMSNFRKEREKREQAAALHDR